MNNTKEDLLTPSTFSVPLIAEAHQLAKKFYSLQSNIQKAKQVYLNTLAVYAVSYYLECLGIKTNKEASNSWHKAMQILANTADLILEGIGKLECRFVLPNEEFCYVPPEVWEERIGYVIVQLNQSLTEATLLGFVPKVETENIPINQLQTLENLLEHIHQYKQQKQQFVKLSEWFNNLFDAAWTLLEPPQFAFRFRGIDNRNINMNSPMAGIHRGKILNLERAGEQVSLFIGLIAKNSLEMDISVGVYSQNEQTDLPQNLQLMVLDEVGQTIMQAQSRSNQNIEFEFSGEQGEQFSVKVCLDDVSVTEAFVI
jgi:Protein of unknown function (DUF1822)